jgi:sugar/nucleoside kinase (ribokinase family)
MNFLGVFGHVVLDYVISVPRFPEPNASIAVKSQKVYFGGTGANLARMAARMGVKTSLASFVGEDFPRDYYDALKREGVELEDLQVMKGYSTPVCYVFSDGKNQMNFIDQGPMSDSHEFDLLKRTIRFSSLVHVGTGNPEYYERVVAYANKLKKDVAFDPAQEIHYVYNSKQFKNIIRSAKYFFCNEVELRKAFKFLNSRKIDKVLDYVDVLILTRGEKGSRIYTKDEGLTIPAVKPKKFVDATGAGDAYRAGFYAALSRGYDLNVCGHAGAIASSLVVESLGAQTKIPNWDDIKGKLKTYVQSLI